MRRVVISRTVAIVLSGAILVQLGGCIGSLIPAALATGEQVFFSGLLSRLL